MISEEIIIQIFLNKRDLNTSFKVYASLRFFFVQVRNLYNNNIFLLYELLKRYKNNQQKN